MGDIRWKASPRGIELEWPAGFLDSDAGLGLETWIEEWRQEGDLDTTLTLPFALWAELGTPPVESESSEEKDLFQARHTSLARMLGIGKQHVSIESIGHVGAPELSFLLQVDGARIGDANEPTPLARDGSGRTHVLLPATFAVYQRICAWNAKNTSTRVEQLVFLGDLRAHLDRSTSALAESRAPFTYALDEHLREFRMQRPSSVALSWESKKGGAVFDLVPEIVGDDGARRPLDLNRLDPEHPIIEVSANEHVLLDRDVDAVARVAKKQRNKLRKHVEQHFHSPAALVPEGVSLEKVDLSAYSPRVLGFEPIKAERDMDIQSSGVEWYQVDNDSASAFLRLFIAQPGGGIETLELATPDAAKAAVQEIDAAMATTPEPVIEIAGKRVSPTRPLRDRIEREVAAFEANDKPAAETAPTEKKGMLAAKISDDAPLPAGSPAAEIEVPWSTLEQLLLPSCQLKPHQRDGIAWLWRHYKAGRSGVLLADDMGLGKTLQIAAFLALQRAMEPSPGSPSLVVAPVILLDNWREELSRFFKTDVFASLLVLHGDSLRKRTREGTLDVRELQGADYLITNYETLQRHQLSLLRVNWHAVVLDEAQQIKNSVTARSRAARGLKRKFAICSTGTPVENRLGDLWSLYDFLSPHDPFGSAQQFSSEYEADVAEGVRKARVALAYPGPSSSVLRRTKAEALTLPPKTIEMHAVPMTPRQLSMEKQVVLRGRERGGILGILAGLQKLYQHPQLLAPASEGGMRFTVASALEESPKLRFCVELLRKIREAGEKALVFTLWTEMQAMLVQVFKHELGLPRVRVINGDPKQRRHAHDFIRDFSASKGFDVLVLSPLAAGTGLTITAANHVIHYGRWWNPAKEDQATDRAYRIGQTRPVRVHYPVLHHPGNPTLGFDVKLHELVTKKRDVARDFLAPQSNDGDVSTEELDALEGG